MDILSLPIALLGVLDPSTQQGWATTFRVYTTVEECREEVVDIAKEYRVDWPDAIMWCAQPAGDIVVAAPVRPKKNPFY